MRKLLLALAGGLVAAASTAQVPAWTEYIDPNGDFYNIAGLAIDASANTIVVSNVRIPATSSDGIRVTKVSAAGVRQWDYTFDTGFSDSANSVVLDSAGGAYVVGQSGGQILAFKVNPGGSQAWNYTGSPGHLDHASLMTNGNLAAGHGDGINDQYVKVFNGVTGALIGSSQVAANNTGVPPAVQATSSANIVVASDIGYYRFSNTLTQLDYDEFPTPITPVRIRANVANNAVYIGGHTALFDYADLYVSRRDLDDGDAVWIRAVGGTFGFQDHLNDLEVDSAGNVVVVGRLRQFTDFDKSAILKFNGATGSQMWRKTYGSAGPNAFYDTLIGPGDDIFAVGALYTDDRSDWFIKRLATNGTEVWSKTENFEADGLDGGNRIVLDAAGNVYAAGGLHRTLIFPYIFDGGVRRYYQATIQTNPLVSNVAGGTSNIPWTVTLNVPALQNVVMPLSVDLAGASTNVPSVTIPSGQSSANFTLSVPTVPAQTKVTVTSNDVIGQSLGVQPGLVQQVTLNPTTIFSGGVVNGNVFLTSPAPVGGVNVILRDSSGLATTPASVFIPEGQSVGAIHIVTFVSKVNQTITVTAYLNGSSTSASFDLKRSALDSVSVAPGTIAGGASATGTVKVLGVAAESNIVALTSNNANVTVPTQAVIVKGAYQANFNVTTKGVATNTTATITATMNSISKTTTVTVFAAALASVNIPSSVGGGLPASGTLTATGVMPLTGTHNATLSDNSAALVVPATATFGNGTNTASFNMTTTAVAANSTATVTAVFRGATRTATVTIRRAAIESVSASAEVVYGGSQVQITVKLDGLAPAGGAAVSLSSSDPTALTVPASVTIPAGFRSLTFTRTAAVVGAMKSTTITANRFGAATTVITVIP